MKKRIERLKSDDILKICSQQVVLDLAHCVKELVENSLDAEATQVEVRIKQFGLEGIEVSDNGTGIAENEFTKVTERNSTSKIEAFEDLDSVQTFGFRGEALSSVCALGKVQMITAVESPYGHKLVFNGRGELIEQSVHPRQKGTTVIVSDLFHSLPVRGKEFQRNSKREYYKCVQILQEYALICPYVRFNIVHIVKGQRNSVLSTQGNQTMEQNISEILGHKIFKLLIKVDFKFVVGQSETMGKLSGFISNALPDHGRLALDKQYFYLHKRPCSIPKLTRKINEIYRSFNTGGQSPIFILEISLPPGTFDLNVTPDKRTVMIHDENEIIEIIEKELINLYEPSRGAFELKQSLSSTSSTQPNSLLMLQPSVKSFCSNLCGLKASSSIEYVPDIVHVSKKLKNEVPICVSSDEDDQNCSHENCLTLNSTRMNTKSHIPEPLRDLSETGSVELVSDYEKSEGDEKTVVEVIERIRQTPKSNDKKLAFNYDEAAEFLRKLKQAQTTASLQTQMDPQDVTDNEAEAKLQRIVKKEEFKRMKIIGQFNKGFIISLLEHANGVYDLFVVDQHASDEIYLFHKYQQETCIETQRLIVPKEVAIDDLLLALEHETWLRKNGFKIDVIRNDESGKQKLRLLSVPVLYGKVLGSKDFEELVQLMADCPSDVQFKRPSRIRALFASKACRTAYMIGETLSKCQMKTIVLHLSDIENPWNCPHGRPTMRWILRFNCFPVI